MWHYMPRFLYRASLFLVAGLLLLVLLSPALDTGDARLRGWRQVVGIYARDRIVRRVTAVGAIGLLVTAITFFRPQARSRSKTDRSLRGPPPANIVGA
jgi:hypothetical protein